MFWRQKRIQLGTSTVFLTKWPVSIYQSCIQTIHHKKCWCFSLTSVHWCDPVFHVGLLSLFSICGAILFAFHTWMHHVQKAHKHSCQPYLLCAQVIALIFLIQPRLICMGGGIDLWAHLRVPHLLLWKHSGVSALCWNVTLINEGTANTLSTCQTKFTVWMEGKPNPNLF